MIFIICSNLLVFITFLISLKIGFMVILNKKHIFIKDKNIF